MFRLLHRNMSIFKDTLLTSYPPGGLNGEGGPSNGLPPVGAGEPALIVSLPSYTIAGDT